MWLYLILTAQLFCGYWVVTSVETANIVSHPVSHSLPQEHENLYGSDMNGSCTSVVSGTNGDICNGTSVLNDGVIPALSGVNDSTSQWAAWLFTMRRSGTDSIVVSFEVQKVAYDRFELAVFNCPERGIYAPSVTVYIDVVSFLPERSGNGLGDKNVNVTLSGTSCDYLLKFCVELGGSLTASYYNLEFPYQNNSDFVFLGEVTFLNIDDQNKPCGPPELITSTVTLSPPLPTEPDNGTTVPTRGQPELITSTVPYIPEVTTSGTNTATAQGNPPPVSVIIAVVMVILLLLVIVFVIAVVVIFVFMRKHKRKHETDILRSVVMKNEVGGKEYETHDDILDNNYNSPLQSGLWYASGGTPISNPLYSDLDEARRNEGSSSHLSEWEKKKGEVTHQNLSIIDDQYSELNDNQKPSPDMVEEDMYSIPYKRNSSTAPPVPEKSEKLSEYLNSKYLKEAILQNVPEYCEIDRRRSSSVCSDSIGPFPLSNPATLGILNGMSSNPLYHHIDIRPLHTMPQKMADSENSMMEADPIYAEPLPPNAHEKERDTNQNINKSNYDKSLNPSPFMQERENIDNEELGPYSSNVKMLDP